MTNICDDFIGQGNVADATLCDDLINYFKNSELKEQGQVYTEDGDLQVNTQIKDSIELDLGKTLLVDRYFKSIRHIIDGYVARYPSCNMYAPWGVIDSVNLQHYPPGGGFKIWHAERTSTKGKQASRHLVFMTYLNTVTDGGGTEFMNQKLVVDAVKGKTLIWPADWTHTHRGVVSPTQEKYIVTGWFNFL